MTWVVKQIPQELVTPEVMYDINKRHGLLHENLDATLNGLKSLAATARVYAATKETTLVATAIISRVVHGETAEFDLIPVRKFFRGNYRKELQDAIRPLVDSLLKHEKCRRVTAYVPASRAKTVRALKIIGFEEEGEMRKAVRLEGKDPEGLVILGFTED